MGWVFPLLAHRERGSVAENRCKTGETIMGDLKYKDLHKKLHLCVDCSEPAIDGKRRCKKHLYGNNDARFKYSHSHKDKRNALNRRLRERLKKEGRCIACGAPRDDPDRAQCVNCRLGIRKPQLKRGSYAADPANRTKQL